VSAKFAELLGSGFSAGIAGRGAAGSIMPSSSAGVLLGFAESRAGVVPRLSALPAEREAAPSSRGLAGIAQPLREGFAEDWR